MTAYEDGEVRALAHLGLVELSKAAVGIARVHRAVSGAVFGALGVVAGGRTDPVRDLHDTVSDAVYTSITEVLDSAAIVADVLPETRTPPTHTVAGANVIAILDGLIGDELDARHSPLAPAMAPRVDGQAVDVSVAGLAAAYPDASGHLVVFLHGLMESEHSWRSGQRRSYGARLADDLGVTEVQVRYNTGRSIGANGQALSDLLEAMVLQWPVPVRRVTLVGHSMGGLVIRSACHRGSVRGQTWVAVVRETVALGSPHLGAPLARGVDHASAALRSVSVTRPFGHLLRRRSAGVRDLQHGTLVDPTADPASRRYRDVPLLPDARHLFVTASITRDADHRIGRYLGDGLVLTPSGRGFGRERHIGFEASDGIHLGRANHFTLLNHDEIYRWLRDALRPRLMLTAG